MKTRTSDNWQSKPGNWDPLKTDFIDFEDCPQIGGSYVLGSNIKTVNCTKAKDIDSDSLIDMFVDDYRLERFWNRHEYYTQKFKTAGYVMTPDFSLLIGMPVEMMQWNVYRNRIMGYIFEKANIKVIPTVSWAEEKSFNFCTKGIKPGSTIAVSNVGAANDKKISLFNYGLYAIMELIKPKQVIISSTKKYRHLYNEEIFYHINPYWDILRPKIKQQWEEEAVNQ
jgi:hypothetical protein